MQLFSTHMPCVPHANPVGVPRLHVPSSLHQAFSHSAPVRQSSSVSHVSPGSPSSGGDGGPAAAHEHRSAMDKMVISEFMVTSLLGCINSYGSCTGICCTCRSLPLVRSTRRRLPAARVRTCLQRTRLRRSPTRNSLQKTCRSSGLRPPMAFCTHRERSEQASSRCLRDQDRLRQSSRTGTVSSIASSCRPHD
jgi:hypothetical protein